MREWGIADKPNNAVNERKGIELDDKNCKTWIKQRNELIQYFDRASRLYFSFIYPVQKLIF